MCPFACATLDWRCLIDDQIYPTGLPEQFYCLMVSSLLCTSLGLLRCGTGGRLQTELLWHLPACFQPLSSLWDPLHLQKDLCSLANRHWCPDGRMQPSRWRVPSAVNRGCLCPVSVTDRCHIQVVPCECQLASHEAQPGKDSSPGLFICRIFGTSGVE